MAEFKWTYPYAAGAIFFLLPVGILEVSDSKGRATAGVVDDVFDDSLKKK
jgi:hypothetical protein